MSSCKLIPRPSYDFANKKIGIIGSGSSSIQIVPALQKLPGTQISTFVRNQTWISPSFGQDVYDELGMQSAKCTSSPLYFKLPSMSNLTLQTQSPTNKKPHSPKTQPPTKPSANASKKAALLFIQ